ncbi:MAG: 2Fe-2S iron-sulfur cluster-binding protein [Geothrix sp.]|nr:2Fe-2S iron-sulfur cluster-binding protein [Geothrix sp.]
MTDTFLLDGKEIPFREGQTVLQAALSAGHFIPHLCWRPQLEPHSSCRLCTVIIKGRPFSSCTQPAMKDQEVACDTPELLALRRAVIQMIFVEGNHYCPSCEESGHCRLQATAYHLGLQDNHFPQQFPIRERDSSHPEVNMDRDRCIRCETCVRASRDLDRKNIFGIHGRGIKSKLAVNAPSGLLKDTDLAAGDQAVALCPTGCLTVKGVGFKVPIGERVYDKESISAVALREFQAQEALRG